MFIRHRLNGRLTIDHYWSWQDMPRSDLLASISYRHQYNNPLFHLGSHMIISLFFTKDFIVIKIYEKWQLYGRLI
jgi:hypothetical protein